MTKLLTFLKPKDVVAVLAIIAFGIYQYHTTNGDLNSVLTLLLGMYFGHRTSGHDSGK